MHSLSIFPCSALTYKLIQKAKSTSKELWRFTSGLELFWDCTNHCLCVCAAGPSVSRIQFDSTKWCCSPVQTSFIPRGAIYAKATRE